MYNVLCFNQLSLFSKKQTSILISYASTYSTAKLEGTHEEKFHQKTKLSNVKEISCISITWSQQLQNMWIRQLTEAIKASQYVGFMSHLTTEYNSWISEKLSLSNQTKDPWHCYEHQINIEQLSNMVQQSAEEKVKTLLERRGVRKVFWGVIRFSSESHCCDITNDICSAFVYITTK